MNRPCLAFKVLPARRKVIMVIGTLFIFLSFSSALGSVIPRVDSSFNLSVVHVNDFHARFEPTTWSSGTCKNVSACIGGFSRLYKQIMDIIDDKPDSILLNAGDNFQGTIWYTIGKWNVTQEFLNKLPFDAMVLGNHEFDDKIAGVVPFIKSCNFPTVVCNIDDSLEPSIQGLYNKSVVIERHGKKIGIIGVILSTTNQIASTENLKFLPESASVNEEAERLVREEGVFTNIVLSHSGYDVEQAIAANASEKIGLVVGAHSHTFLWTGDDHPGPDTPGGDYPTIITSKNGKKVLVVQASAYTKYLGNITVFYDDEGEVVDYSGEPIFLDTPLPTDEQIDEDLEPWKEIMDSTGNNTIGSSLVTLDRSKCYYAECLLGNFVTDAFVYAYTDKAAEDEWTYAAIAFINAGGTRADIPIGNITYNDMVTAQPFSNTVDVGELQGKYIKELLEQAAKPYSVGRAYSSISLIQVSGIHVVYNLTDADAAEKVVSVKVRCQKCLIPVYEDLDLEKYYRVVVPSFLVGGGDGFTAISENIQNFTTGEVDMDVFVKYLANRSPVFQEEEGRITIIGEENIVVRGFDL